MECLGCSRVMSVYSSALSILTAWKRHNVWALIPNQLTRRFNMKRTYRFTIEVETSDTLPNNIREQLLNDMCVQSESLSDGTYEHIADPITERVVLAKSEDITPHEGECPMFPKSQGW